MIKTIKPLIILVLILYLLECVNIWIMNDKEYHPMPGQYAQSLTAMAEQDELNLLPDDLPF